jgi:hypothetical protein
VPDVPRATLVGDNVHDRPEEGETVAVKLTIPVKPSSGATVTIEVPATPASTVTLVGLPVTVKSLTV